MNSPLVINVAKAFADVLREWFSDAEFVEMRWRNAHDEAYHGDSGACASHDFCDANVAMAEAIESVLGHEPRVYDVDGVEGEDCALWNAAWAYAKLEYLTEK